MKVITQKEMFEYPQEWFDEMFQEGKITNNDKKILNILEEKLKQFAKNLLETLKTNLILY